jgi:hypothetical protein
MILALSAAMVLSAPMCTKTAETLFVMGVTPTKDHRIERMPMIDPASPLLEYWSVGGIPVGACGNSSDVYGFVLHPNMPIIPTKNLYNYNVGIEVSIKPENGNRYDEVKDPENGDRYDEVEDPKTSKHTTGWYILDRHDPNNKISATSGFSGGEEFGSMTLSTTIRVYNASVGAPVQIDLAAAGAPFYFKLLSYTLTVF